MGWSHHLILLSAMMNYSWFSINGQEFRHFSRLAKSRYVHTGVVSTLLGPSIFWICYGAGPVIALSIAECITHILRYNAYRHYVYRNSSVYTVTLAKYLAASIPLYCINFLLTSLLAKFFGRDVVIPIVALISISTGYILNKTTFKRR